MTLLDLTLHPAMLADGTELSYARAGAGFPLIFVHGAMGDWRSWAPQWDVFLPHFDCVSYSRRYSHPNRNVLNTRSHNALVDARDLEGLMDVLSIDAAVLVGSSYGGFTALAMAVQAPERVKALVSVEAPMMRFAEASEAGAQVVRRFRESTIAPAREAFERGYDIEGVRILTGGIVGTAPNDVPEPVMKRRLENLRAARSLSLSDDEFPLLDPQALAALPMPVLLMSGARTAPIHAAIFAAVVEAMPRADKRIVEGAGHSVSQQQPEAFNAMVLAFLADNGLLAPR